MLRNRLVSRNSLLYFVRNSLRAFCSLPDEDVGRQRNSSVTCFNCGEQGHFARDCPKSVVDGVKQMKCFNCGQPGHISRECSQPRDNASRVCYKCGQTGHISNQCTEPTSENSIRKCYKCGQAGHLAFNCTEPKAGY